MDVSFLKVSGMGFEVTSAGLGIVGGWVMCFEERRLNSDGL